MKKRKGKHHLSSDKNNQPLSRKQIILSVLLIAASSLLLAFLLKLPCLQQQWGGDYPIQYKRFCYNDLQPLFDHRDLRFGAIPYISHNKLEYPVLIGMQMWISSQFSKTSQGFFIASLPFLIGAALLTLLGLYLAVGASPHLLWFAGAPPLILHGFTNWDLLALAFLGLSMGFWARRKLLLSGACLGLGAAAKLFPILIIFPLIVFIMRNFEGKKELSFREAGRGALTFFLSAVVAYVFVNGPIILWDHWVDGKIDGWLGVFQFHKNRPSTPETFWYWIAEPIFNLSPRSSTYMQWSSIAGIFIFFMGSGGILFNQWRKNRPPWASGAAIICLLLLVSKIYSQQFSLWILPFFVVVRTPYWLIAVFFMMDFSMLVTRFNWYIESPSQGPGFWLELLIPIVFIKCLIYLVLTWWYTFKASDRVTSEKVQFSA